MNGDYRFNLSPDMRLFILTFSCLVISFSGLSKLECLSQLAQRTSFETSPKIWFPHTTIEKNTQHGGDGHFYFWFKNIGTAPLVIYKASGSGGSTVPYRPHAPIEPGKWGLIKIKYDTKRIGPFRRSSTVHTNVSNEWITLKMIGTITPKTDKPFVLNTASKLYCYDLVLDQVVNGNSQQGRIEIINRDTVAHQILELDDSASFFGLKIQPIDSLPITVPAEGRVFIPVTVETNFSGPLKSIQLKLRTDENLEEPFADLKINALSKSHQYARIKFDSTFIYRDYNYGDKAAFSFRFQNVGTAPLIISTVKYSGGIYVRKYPKDPVFPGQYGEIKMTYYTRRQGRFHKTITVQTNGYYPTVVLRVRGEVFPPIEMAPTKE